MLTKVLICSGDRYSANQMVGNFHRENISTGPSKGAPHQHFLPCHSFSHTTLKSPCAEQGSVTWFPTPTPAASCGTLVRLTSNFSPSTHFLIQI